MSGRQRTEAMAEQEPYLGPKLVCRGGGGRVGRQLTEAKAEQVPYLVPKLVCGVGRVG